MTQNRVTGIYALRDDPDYVVFDADLVNGTQGSMVTGTTWADYDIVAVVTGGTLQETAKDTRPLPRHHIYAFEGQEFGARQLLFGNAPAAVVVELVKAPAD